MTKLFIMTGLVASGKTTYANKLAVQENAFVHSSDDLREELFGDVSNQDNNEQLFRELHKRIRFDLDKKRNVIYDATNLSYKKRIAFLESFKNSDIEKICVLMATPYEICLENNKNRDRFVPTYVIERMYLNINIPQLKEGFDQIRIIWNYDEKLYNLDVLMERLCGMRQDNKYHKLTVGEHCITCRNNIKENNIYLQVAGLLHDIGKSKTKKFQNGKGEPTVDAHYYGHQNVSAYDALFYLKANYKFSDSEVLYICNLIMWHMQMYNIGSEKSRTKFIRLVGEDVYEKLLILNNADINAH